LSIATIAPEIGVVEAGFDAAVIIVAVAVRVDRINERFGIVVFSLANLR
jgi:hypothetical protein